MPPNPKDPILPPWIKKFALAIFRPFTSMGKMLKRMFSSDMKDE